MPTLNELLSDTETDNYQPVSGYGINNKYEDNKFIDIIDRTIGAINNQRSTKGESQSQMLTFRLPRKIDGYDITQSGTNIMIHYEIPVSGDSLADDNAPINVMANDDYVLFSWLIPLAATQIGANIEFMIYAINTADNFLYKTLPYSYKIDYTMDIGGSIPEPETSWYQNFVTQMQGYVNEAKEYKNQTNELLNGANNKFDELKSDLDEVVDYTGYALSKVDYDALLSSGTAIFVDCDIQIGDSIKVEYSELISGARELTIGLCEEGSDNISQYLMQAVSVSEDGSVTVKATINANRYKIYSATYSTHLKITRLSRAGFSLKGVKVINAIQHGVSEGTHIYNAMNAILDDIGDDGAVIYLPKGTYTCNGQINWKSNVSLVGDGIGQTIIKSVYGTVFGGSNLDNITFRDFTIDGQDNPATNYGKGIFFTYLTNATFENLEIKNTKESGLGCDFFINGTIHNVRCDNCGWGGDLSSQAYGCSGIGIGVGRFNRGMESLSISDCHTDNCKQYGMFFERQYISNIATDFPVGVSVSGCSAEGNRVGFGVSGCDNVAFTACTAYNNHSAGFAYDKGTMGNTHTYGTRPKFIGCVAKSNGQNVPQDYPLFYTLSNGHGFVALDDFLGMEMIGCSAIDNLLNGLYIADGLEELSIIGGTFDENGDNGIKISGALNRFRIEPSFVQNNGNVGIEFDGTVNRGCIKDSIITGNQIGVKSLNTLSNTIVQDNQSYDNFAVSDVIEFTAVGEALQSVTIANGTTIKVKVKFNDMSVSNNLTVALMKNNAVVQKPFNGFIPSVAENEVTITTTDDIDQIKVVKTGGSVDIDIDAIGAEQNWDNVVQA